MTVLTKAFIGLAVFGLILSVVAYACSILGIPQPLVEYTLGLHLGVFVVWLPAVIAGSYLVKGFKGENYWRTMMRGCPELMRKIAYGFFSFAILNFFVFLVVLAMTAQGLIGEHAPDAHIEIMGFAGHWMAFYAPATALLYSALVVKRFDPARRCPNQHPVSPAAQYCEQCGANIE